MMSFLKAVATRFHKEEEGSVTVEFAIYFTIFFAILTASFEIAFINLRHSMLERSVDVITRDLRLSTGDDMDYASIKQAICDTASVIKDCEDNLMLEMIEVDPRNVTTIDPNPAPNDRATAWRNDRWVRFDGVNDVEIGLLVLESG